MSAPPNTRTSALMCPRYSTAGVKPEVSVLMGRSFAVSVVDHAAGVHSPSAQRLAGVPTRHIEKDIPLLISIGSDDSLGGEKSVRTLAEKYLSRSGLTDVEVVIYAGARHEIFNELNKQEVITDLVVWLDARLARS